MDPLSGQIPDSTAFSTHSERSQNPAFARVPVIQAVQQLTLGPQANQPSSIEPVTAQTNQDPFKELALLLQNMKVPGAAPLNPDQINQILDRLARMNPASIPLDYVMDTYRLLIDLIQNSIILPHDATSLFSRLLVFIIVNDETGYNETLSLLATLIPDKLPPLTPDARETLKIEAQSLDNLPLDLIQKFAGHPDLKRMLPRDPNAYAVRICNFLDCTPEFDLVWEAIPNITGLMKGIDAENSLALQDSLRKAVGELKNEHELTPDFTASISKAIQSLRKGGCLNHFSSLRERAEFDKLCREL